MELLMLYSSQCHILLEQACEKAEKEKISEEEQQPLARSLAAFHFITGGDSSEDETSQPGGGDSEDSSSDEETEISEQQQQQQQALPNIGELSPQVGAVAPPVIPVPSTSKPNPKKGHQQKQREQEVKRLSHNLHRRCFTYDTESELAVHIPLSLLPPRQPKWRQCQHIQNVATALSSKPVVVLLLRSGRFAAAIYQQEKCIDHTSSTRYTVRKGQGKAQSAQDGSRRPKSIGSQLRRAGEQQLKEDVHRTLHQWKSHIDKAALILISCPKTMRSTLFDVLDKTDSRFINVPFDVGRPSFEGTGIVYETLMTVFVGQAVDDTPKSELLDSTTDIPTPKKAPKEVSPPPPVVPEKEQVIIPLTTLHEVSRDANLTALLDLLRNPEDLSIDQLAGYDFMTPLHFAAESKMDPSVAAACISALLIQGHADPCAVDARNRVPYFLASHERTREAFRKARAVLGEDYCDWAASKVGPPLTDDDVQAKKEKEAEKKRRKRQKQKEKDAKEKAQAQELAQRRKQQEEEEKKADDAKRIRDALDPKSIKKENVCDFCQIEVKGRKRQQMLQRLDYIYCSSECVQKHKRELMAKAAMERFK
jgi:Bacteroidetes VLRF1 release factor/Vms1-associating treble clef domain